MGSYQPYAMSSEEREEWQTLRRGLGPIPEEELERCEIAARQLRERLIAVPYFAERDRQGGMHFWRRMQASDYPVG